MPLEDIANYFSIFETIVVTISLIIIIFQVNDSKKLAKAANVQSLVELTSPLNLEMINNRDLAELWYTRAESEDEIDKYRYRKMILHWLNIHENIYYQHRANLLGLDIYKGWDSGLEDLIKSRELWKLWDEGWRGKFQIEFAEHVEAIVEKYDNTNQDA